jgi:hypothetical protein
MKYVLVVSMLSLVLVKQIVMMINLPYQRYDRAVCYNYHCWACNISIKVNKGNNKITELRTIFQRESQSS